jgi:hypothetical protein
MSPINEYSPIGLTLITRNQLASETDFSYEPNCCRLSKFYHADYKTMADTTRCTTLPAKDGIPRPRVQEVIAEGGHAEA